MQGTRPISRVRALTPANTGPLIWLNLYPFRGLRLVRENGVIITAASRWSVGEGSEKLREPGMLKWIIRIG